jgi:integrase
VARTVRDAVLDTRTARARLKPRGKPYYRTIDPGLHLGYRRSADGGKWVVRAYLGQQAYRVENIATADDHGEPDGHLVLSFSQAQTRARARAIEMSRQAAGLPADMGPYTVKMAFHDYVIWLEHEGRGERTVADTRAALEAHASPKLGHTRVDRLTTTQIKGWLSGLAKTAPRLRTTPGKKQRHRSVDMSDDEVQRQRQSAANRVLTYVRAALNLAWGSNKVESDKAWRAVKPFKGADASRARYLQLPECRRLIGACDSDDDLQDLAELVQGGLHTGARYSELARLGTPDFNPDVGTVAVRKSKSGKPRHVVLTEEGRAFFADLVRRAGNRQLLFVRADGEPWRKSSQARPMKAACAAAGIVPAAGFHILRHTWASHAVMNGVPLLVVARNLGHKDTRMVEKHYGHLAPSYEADAIRAGAPRFGVDSSQGNVSSIAAVRGKSTRGRPTSKASPRSRSEDGRRSRDHG